MIERDEAPSVDLHIWLQDLNAKYADLQDYEILTPKEQMGFNESLIDFLFDIINSMMVMQIKLKNFENVYELNKFASITNDIKDKLEPEEQDEIKALPDNIYL